MLLYICRKLFLSQVNYLFFFSVDHQAAQQTVGFELPEPPTPPSLTHPPTANCCHHSSAALQNNSFRSCLYVKMFNFERSFPSLIEHCEMKNRPRSADEWFGLWFHSMESNATIAKKRSSGAQLGKTSRCFYFRKRRSL